MKRPRFLTPIPYTFDILSMLIMAYTGDLLYEHHDHFQKNTCRNRCYIRSNNGIQRLTIPIDKSSGNRIPMSQVRPYYPEGWAIKHWRAIQTAYGKSPFFPYYAPMIEPLFLNTWDKLTDMTLHINQCLIQWTIPHIKVELSAYFTPVSLQPTLWDRRSYEISSSFHKLSTLHIPDYQSIPLISSFFNTSLSCLDLIFFLGPRSTEFLMTYADKISDWISMDDQTNYRSPINLEDRVDNDPLTGIKPEI